MSKTNKAAAEKAKNYSAEQEAALIAASPVTFEQAHAFAEEFGKSVKSIVAKIHSLKAQDVDIEYIPKEKPVKRVGKVTKAELVAKIETALGDDAEGTLAGLVKAPAADLHTLLLHLS